MQNSSVELRKVGSDEFEPSERKYQVFISSTFSDLADRRQQALDVVVDRLHMPVALERSEAADTPVTDVIKRAVRNCQLYILILGHRYGSLTPGQDKSFTELEYDYACKNGLTVLPFVMDRGEADELRHDLYSEKSDIAKEERANEEKYLAFRARILDPDRHYCRVFKKDADDFRYLVVQSLYRAEKECKRPGWVREPEDGRLREVLATASRNHFIVDVVDALSGREKLDEKCALEKERKQAVAVAFQEMYLQEINDKKINLFLESGSTIAYIASKLKDGLTSAKKLDKNGLPRVTVSSNNVLAHLILWLRADISCVLFPSGTPEETYGATFGLLNSYATKPPVYPPGPLSETEEEAIHKLREATSSIPRWKKPTLLLGATSGLQLTDNFTLAGGREPTPGMRRCRGPHVGSYRNKLFKRFMYRTKVPLLIILTDDKIDCEIDEGKCHFICDDMDHWQTFVRDHPVAFGVGCRRKHVMRVINYFRDYGFIAADRHPGDSFTAVLVRNQKFIEQFEKPNGISLPPVVMTDDQNNP